MIGFLRGGVVGSRPCDPMRKGAIARWLTLEVQGVGYDLMTTSNTAHRAMVGEELQLFCHLLIRDDQMVLYGFLTSAERDLFRLLIQVSGVGAQMALALLDRLAITDLVAAIVMGNTRILSLTPGIGQKTAERLCLELRTKLAEWRAAGGGSPMGVVPAAQEEIEMTLLALGYGPEEIQRAIAAVQPRYASDKDIEPWLKATITWLSQHTS
ncbi:MAG: Holliday junction branch migration protein RuvA [Oscillatoriales cyanobacterium SM2_2_1]|nr:Holliday junction branch migration protein RuvA [Oscillatoriales cyanobacterium SM2_2_1]